MLITPDTAKRPKKSTKPAIKWQTGHYAACQEYRFHIPYGVLMLCKIWDCTPNDLIGDFLDNLNSGSWERKGRETAKQQLYNYMIEMQYGQQHYSTEEIRTQFMELDALGQQWPEKGKDKIRKQYCEWRKHYIRWWFKKWFKKNNRHT